MLRRLSVFRFPISACCDARAGTARLIGTHTSATTPPPPPSSVSSSSGNSIRRNINISNRVSSGNDDKFSVVGDVSKTTSLLTNITIGTESGTVSRSATVKSYIHRPLLQRLPAHIQSQLKYPTDVAVCLFALAKAGPAQSLALAPHLHTLAAIVNSSYDLKPQGSSSASATPHADRTQEQADINNRIQWTPKLISQALFGLKHFNVDTCVRKTEVHGLERLLDAFNKKLEFFNQTYKQTPALLQRATHGKGKERDLDAMSNATNISMCMLGIADLVPLSARRQKNMYANLLATLTSLLRTLAHTLRFKTPEGQAISGQAVGNMCYGLRHWTNTGARSSDATHSGTEDMSAAMQYTQDPDAVCMFVEALVDKMKTSGTTEMSAQNISNALYGLRYLSADVPHHGCVRELIQLLTDSLANTHIFPAGAEGEGGEQEEDKQSRQLPRGQRVYAHGDMSARDVANGIFGLQSCTAESESVRKLLQAFTALVINMNRYVNRQRRASTNVASADLADCLLSAQGFGMCAYGLKNMSDAHIEVRQLLLALTFNVSLQFQPAAGTDHAQLVLTRETITNMFFGLQNMSMQYEECRTVLGMYTDLLERSLASSHEASSVVFADAKAISNIFYGLRNMASHYVDRLDSSYYYVVPEVKRLVGVLADALTKACTGSHAEELVLEPVEIANAFYGLRQVNSRYVPKVLDIVNVLTQQLTHYRRQIKSTHDHGNNKREFTSRELHQIFFGLQSKDSGAPVVRELLSVLTDMLRDPDIVFHANALAAALYGLQSCHLQHSEVQQFVSAVAHRITNNHAAAKDKHTLSPATEVVPASVFDSKYRTFDEDFLGVDDFNSNSSNEIWTPRHFATACFGLQNFSASLNDSMGGSTTGVAAALEQLVDVLVLKLYQQHTHQQQLQMAQVIRDEYIWNGRVIGNVLFGLHRLSYKACPSMGDFLSLIATSIQRTVNLNARMLQLKANPGGNAFIRLSGQEIGNAVFGLKTMSSDSSSALAIVRQLNKLIRQQEQIADSIQRRLGGGKDNAQILLSPQEMANALFGLQMMSSDHEEVRALLQTLLGFFQSLNYHKQHFSSSAISTQQATRYQMNDQEIECCIVGLTQMDVSQECVRQVLQCVYEQLVTCRRRPTKTTLVSILKAMDSDNPKEYDEVRKLLRILDRQGGSHGLDERRLRFFK
jgi:hypothetical protein